MAKKTGTGVILGRFQSFELPPLVKKAISRTMKKHARTIVFITANPAPSDVNPIDWDLRWQMVYEEYGDKLEYAEMPDLPDWRIWSQEIDRRILEMKPTGEVSLYMMEEEYLSEYSGMYGLGAFDITQEEFLAEVKTDDVQSMRDFMAGMMYATLNRFPTVYPTVDIAVFRNDYREVLLARKANETRFRFPGGFVDPEDENYEDAVLRELGEECGEIEITGLAYIGSTKIEDWRYRGSQDCVMTHFYICELVSGEPAPDDDISELRWVEVTRVREDHFVAEHKPLFKYFEAFLTEPDDDDDDD